MPKEKMVKQLFWLGSESKSLEHNTFITAEEAILEAKRIAKEFSVAIPIYLLINGISVRYATVTPGHEVKFDPNIFTDGSRVIQTILATIDELQETNAKMARTAVQTITDLALEHEAIAILLSKEDYKDLLGSQVIEEIEKAAGENADAFFKDMARIDTIVDSQRLPMPETDITNLRSLLDSYVYVVQHAPEDTANTNLPQMVKNLAGYVKMNIQL